MIQATNVAHRTVKIRDLDVFYCEAGPKDATTVLLLHGFPTSSQLFRNLVGLWPTITACSIPTTPASAIARCRATSSLIPSITSPGS